MTNFDKWARTGIHIDKKADIEKEEKCKKEIEDLVRGHKWKLEKPIRSLLSDVILVKTDVPAKNKRSLHDIEEFKGKLESIFKRYDLDIEEFYDKAISNDLQNRRIEIKLKRKN
jgi:hypothetical protein